jgi:monovalent cation:proton antiporter-2 (CPA2) family protein
MDGSLSQLIVFLAAAAIAAPLGRRCGVGSVIGYLIAGIVIGRTGLGAMVGEPTQLHNFAELGVAMFLFLIGLELRPRRLWALRYAVFGAGGLQVVATTSIFTLLGLYSGLSFGPSLLIGLAISLSSTVFALQTLEERGELTARHGRLAFSILLFQDIAAIPMIILVGFLAAGNGGGEGPTLIGFFKGIAVIALIVLAGRFLLNRVYAVIARTGVREGMTASALLTVVGIAYLMHLVGMSPALGTFIAGILLADSEYRHQIESDVAPFEGLLLGLFFMTVGMALNVRLLLTEPGMILMVVALIVGIKAAVLYGVGRWQDLKQWSARRLALVASQGGEFAFVLLTAGAAGYVVDQKLADSLAVAVTLSMGVTPLLLMADDFYNRRFKTKPEPKFDNLPKKDGHVVIAGFGRVGQIAARILRANRIPFTALDISPEQVNLVNQFGNKIYYGDASRLGILEAAMTKDARAFILAIDDVDASVRTAQIMRNHFPHVPVFARARNRQHVHWLMDLGIENIERETFLSALDLTRDVLRGLGMPEKRTRFIIETFKERDEKRLYEDYKIQSDLEKLRVRALKQSQELEELFAQDVVDTSETTEAPATPKIRKLA